MTTPQLNPGDRLLDKYRVERVLGQGGMGIVVAARHLELGELYAIKVMLPHMLNDQDAVGRFLREARASARLKNEHVARVHDVGHAPDGTLFMVMEHLEGDDLKQHLLERGRFPVDEAVGYVLQACEALIEAHEHGIIHRDIKPANMFLTRKRKSGAVQLKVLDFGISKELKADARQDLTRTGTMLGSPLYMSPEQMMHAREVDGRTDIWSLGVVLYELLTGTVPFPGETFTQVVQSVLNLAPKSIRGHAPDVPPAIERVIMRCLSKDPGARYPTVEAFATALDAAHKNPMAYAEQDFDSMPATAHGPTLRAGLPPLSDDAVAVALASTVENPPKGSNPGSGPGSWANPADNFRIPIAPKGSNPGSGPGSWPNPVDMDLSFGLQKTKSSESDKRGPALVSLQDSSSLASSATPTAESTTQKRDTRKMVVILPIVLLLAAGALAFLGMRLSTGNDTKTKEVVVPDSSATGIGSTPSLAPSGMVAPRQTDAPLVVPVNSTPIAAPSASSTNAQSTTTAPRGVHTKPVSTTPTAPTVTTTGKTAPNPSGSGSPRWRQGPL